MKGDSMTSGNNFLAVQSFGSSVLAGVARFILALYVIAMVILPTVAQGQASPTPQESTGQEGIERAGYQIHQSLEFGYRVTDTVGNDSMYETLVDLHTGPRLLEQTLSMKSDNHEGVLFDDLYVNSFGWGGDPENVLRARASKYQWY